MELSRETDDKEIVFCGKYNMGSYIDKTIQTGYERNGVFSFLYNQIDERYYHHQKMMDTNVNSLINWSMGASPNNSDMNCLSELFSYCGFDLKIKKCSDEERERFTAVAEQLQMHPYDIKETDSVVLVYLGS